MSAEAGTLTPDELALLRESTDPQYRRLPMPERALVARLLAAGTPTEEREVVDCDEGCGAFVEPVTLAEYRDAWEHWRSHGYLYGCSHGA